MANNKFVANKRLPGSRAASRAAVRGAMARPPSPSAGRRDQPGSANHEGCDPALPLPTPPPLLRKLSSTSNAAVARVLAAVAGAGVKAPSADLLALIVAECSAKSGAGAGSAKNAAGEGVLSKRATLVEAVQRQELSMMRAEATSLQKKVANVEVQALQKENERLKAENVRLREANRGITERARKSVEEAQRISEEAWEMASTHAHASEARLDESSLDESSRVSDTRASRLSVATRDERSLDVRLACADAATPPAKISLLRQMAENNKRLKEQLAM